jgi:hypothetical protein
MIKMTCVLAVLLMAASSAMAVTVKGVGAGPCSDWTNKREQTDSTLKYGVESWLLGYMSAIAEDNNRNFLSGTEAETIFKAVDMLCELKPGQPTTDAARHLVGYMSNQGH